jgi:hypothetical protein
VQNPPSKAPVAEPVKSATPEPQRHAARPQPKAAPQPESELGFLAVNSDPWGAVYVDGNKAADWTPVMRLPVRRGTHRVWISSPERKERSPVRVVSVEKGATKLIGFKW